ncbi:MAG TPA: serine/threonine-protein kinase [Kineosporiaceae bacterium]|nr:serine/threonine-protein kinase [Kineosporiaceae bacterium]
MSVPISIGRYQIGPRLGAGGFAVVWLAHDESLDTTIAIKVLAENWVGQGDLRDRFLAEARMLRRAASSRIVQVFDIGELPDGRPYFVMEYADLGTLGDRIARSRPSLVEALRLTAEVARGAAELHRLDIVHRDLKPSNVLIRSTPDGQERLLIADLGIAKNLGQGPALTMSVGSTGYMAPEQSMPDSRVDARADVYSLGALGFQLITGQQPGSWGPVLPAEGADPSLPEPVRQLLIQTLAWEPGRRWPDAASLAERLDELANEFESADQAEIPHRPVQPNRVEVMPASNSGMTPEPGSGPGLRSAASRRSASSRRSVSGRRAGSGRRGGSGLHAGATTQPGSGISSRIRDRRVMLSVGLVIVALIWVEFRILHHSAAGTVSQANPATRASPTARAVIRLADGAHNGVLVASSKGKVTFIMVNLLLRGEALAQCRKDFGQVPAKAVCGSYYFPRIEAVPRTIPVAKDAAVGYIVNVNRKGVLYGQLNGADMAKLYDLSKQYQVGKVFTFRTKDGIFLGGSQDPLGCKDIDGIPIDGRTEWTSRCVTQLGLQ